MTLPRLPGIGDTLRENLPALGQTISSIINPERDRLRAILNLITADPTKADAYNQLQQANPQLMTQIAGPQGTTAVGGGRLTTPARQRERVGEATAVIQENAAEASKFDPQRALVGLQLDQANLNRSNQTNRLLENQVNNTIAGQALIPFSVDKFLAGGYTPDEEAKYFAATGDAIEARLRARMNDQNNYTARQGQYLRNTTGGNYDDVMRAATARNAQIAEIEKQIGAKKIAADKLPSKYNEINQLEQQRWALNQVLGFPESQVVQWVEKPGRLWGTNWEQELVDPKEQKWDYTALARSAGINAPGTTSTSSTTSSESGTTPPPVSAPASAPSSAPIVEWKEVNGGYQTPLGFISTAKLEEMKKNNPALFEKEVPKEIQAKVK